MTTGLLLLDSNFQSDDKMRPVMYWSERDISSQHFSLPNLVENYADQLRQEYAAWCYELGNKVRTNSALARKFKVAEHPSFWCMSSIVEASPLNTPTIYTVFKLRALELFILEHKIATIELCSNDKDLHTQIKNFCNDLNVVYTPASLSKKRRSSFKNFLFNRLAQSAFSNYVQAVLIWLRCCYRYYRYFRQPISMSSADRQLTVVSYFPNIDQDLAKQGIYYSRYWGEAQKLIEQSAACNWIWIYGNNEHYQLSQAVKLRNRFASLKAESARYYFVEEFLSTRSLCRALSLYLKMVFRNLTHHDLASEFKLSGSDFNFFAILKNDWQNSFLGKTAMYNSLKIVEFAAMVDVLPKQKICFYTWENQPWEQALIAAWRVKQKTPLYGFQHASLAYFDLRNFKDPRFYSDTSSLVPDRLLANGAGSTSLLANFKLPAAKILPVEATRFSYLCSRKPEKTVHINMLLVVTGYSKRLVMEQLYWLDQIWCKALTDRYPRIVIKAHPNQPVSGLMSQFTYLRECEISYQNLDQLLPEASLVYLDNHTTASIEALLMNIPIVIHVPTNFFNLSPLYRYDLSERAHINFATTRATLRDFLLLEAPKNHIEKDYFYFSQDFYRWKKLLNDLSHEDAYGKT